MPTKTPAIGTDDFDGLTCSLDDQEIEVSASIAEKATSRCHAETKRFVVKLVLGFIFIALCATGLFGMIKGEWDPVEKVYLFAAPLLGAIFATYI